MDRELFKERYPDLLVMTETQYDKAIIGVVTRIGCEAVCYDEDIVRSILMEGDGMTEEEAQEYIDFNMKGAWVGEHTPFFLDKVV